MPYIELYDDDILDVISLGEFASDFNELRGDYIKVQVLRGDSDAVLDTFYSNRILFKYPTVDEYYFGDYHYHPDQPDMGFCTEGVHTDVSITNLKPLLEGGSINEPLNSETKYKKHFDIFKDGEKRYGSREWSPNIVRRLEESCETEVLASGFPAEIVDDEPEDSGEEVIVRR